MIIDFGGAVVPKAIILQPAHFGLNRRTMAEVSAFRAGRAFAHALHNPTGITPKFTSVTFSKRRFGDRFIL